MLELKGITKVYETDGLETTALSNINLRIDPGEFVAIMGPSGCGKSTFLNILGLLDTPSSGHYLVDGQDVAGLSEDTLADVRRDTVGFIFQSFNLIDELTVRQNVMLALTYHETIDHQTRHLWADDALARVGISHRADHYPRQLSGGQQQRVAIARAIVGRPKLLLADEPTGNLDSRHGQEVMEVLQDLNAAGATIVMVTHSPAHADFARRVVHLFDGSVVAEHQFAA